ncbi:ATP-binding cassette domain-containing protein [Clostridium sp. SM-530-WT-3G]|uniref:iron ABC transporter ATP-binding protein n=1 Tax=Clostridium sp. SM-530-WT-3G TaxID=2725303 RepID=UPI00145E2FB4|nr:ATP-binding cassette domain-containing protein [Clostridium sp. SM-530-WT-3G]NME81629.1 ATP-binding cassette domain-containing protein [Clostridium sp. SM-530-WT-3G]
MIEVKNLTKKYGNKTVVDNVSFNIEKGKITSFIGPNGAGKSTVLSMISRIMDKDNGTVTINGTELEKWNDTELAKKLSILKQSNNINVRLTIREIVSFGRYPYCEGRLKEEDIKYVDEAIAYMELTDIQDRYLDELSGGQRQRAYIAMVLAQNTEYVFLDEPLNNLDMKHSVSMMKVFRRLVDELNKTVVIVMHDINFASVYSDNIVILKNGKLAKNDTTENIINKETLEDIYEINFDIREINGNKISVYF